MELLKLENIINETEYARKNIYKAHLYITKLVTLGESVLAWNESDYNKYHHQRLKTDSVLIEIKSSGVNSLLPVQIDSLRVLLETKETVQVPYTDQCHQVYPIRNHKLLFKIFGRKTAH